MSGPAWERSLSYRPDVISDPRAGSPVVVAASRVKPARRDSERVIYAAGSGASLSEAVDKCIHEGDELHFAQVAPQDRIVRSPADNLPGTVVDPQEILLFRREFFGDKDTTLPAPSGGDPADWVLSRANASSAVAWVPAELCVLDYPTALRSGLPVADSNGLATADSFDAAVVQAFLEVVERDAVSIWWYNRLAMPRLDPGVLGDPLVLRYARWAALEGRRLTLLRLTMDLPIPIVGALTHGADGTRVGLGFGAGQTFADAARHAVQELAQCEANLALLTKHVVEHGMDRLSPQARDLLVWHLTATAREPYMEGRVDVGPADLTFAGGLDNALDLCGRHDLTLLAVDLTSAGGPPVARVFVPGLRSTKPRFGDGRLYNVPPRLGLRSASEADMNRPFPS